VALRWNHYDLAFEAFLRERRNPYVAVDERRRALAEDATLKSLDFIVYSATGLNLLVDVKGRRFPSGSLSHGQRWENWVTEEDLKSMKRWEAVFGDGFRAALVFAYDLVERDSQTLHPEIWHFGRRQYSFYGVWADEYAASMRTRSPSWETVSLPRSRFDDLRQPIDAFLTSPEPTNREMTS
jgi:hypothetical protein